MVHYICIHVVTVLQVHKRNSLNSLNSLIDLRDHVLEIKVFGILFNVTVTIYRLFLFFTIAILFNQIHLI